MKHCQTCELIARRDAGIAPLWDCIHRTAYWDIVHSYNTALPGWLVLVARRHIEAVAAPGCGRFPPISHPPTGPAAPREVRFLFRLGTLASRIRDSGPRQARGVMSQTTPKAEVFAALTPRRAAETLARTLDSGH